MLNLKYIFFLIQLLIFVMEIKSEEIFFRGKYFSDDFRKNQSRAGPSVNERWHLQTLDHFKHSDPTMWYQRYYVNEAYYTASSNSPIFLLVGGESTISASWMTGGFWVERASQHGALLLQLEHRFYGYSRPTADTSTANLQYLTVEQALEDTVSFIVSMQKTYNLHKSNRWILFGGSYPGNLVAWLRLRYPHLVYGAVSSSGPVETIVDYKDYFKIVAESLGTYSRECVTTITEAYASIDQLSQGATGRQTLTSKFSLCEALESSVDFVNDFAQLNNALANNIAGVVQNNKVDYSSNKTIDNICNILTNKASGATSLDRLATLTKVFLYSQKSTCLEYNYQNFVNYFRVTNWEDRANNGGRQWFFQTCNQMGYFQSSSATPHVFGNKFPVEHMIKQCTDLFGEQYNAKFIGEKVSNTNDDFGGKDIVNNVNRVAFVQGSIDPWHALGVVNSTNTQSPAFYIIGTAHCADMNGNGFQDLPQLTLVKTVISNYIRYWLA